MDFISDYLTFAADNEAPEMFHVWGAYIALSAAVGRTVWIPDGDSAIYANIYVMNVGDAGNGKSLALKAPKRLLSELGNIPISKSVETPEGLWRFMGGDKDKLPKPIPSPVAKMVKWPDGLSRLVHPMTIMCNEFINFIGPDPDGWLSALNDIYDEDIYGYRTKGQGEDNLVGPYIVFLGNLTTDVSNKLQKLGVISTGFARRVLWQYGRRKFHDPHPFRRITDAQKAARERCLNHLKTVQQAAGEFFLSNETITWYETWYCDHTVSIPIKSTPQTVGWFTSKPDQVMKLAMLSSLSESNELVINVGHFQRAISYLAELEIGLAHIFGGVGRNELAPVATQIYQYITQFNTPMRVKQLKAWAFSICKPPNDFDQCIEHLVNTNQVIKWNPDFQTGELVATAQTKSRYESAIAQAKTAPPTSECLPDPLPDTSHQIDPSSPPMPPPVALAEEDPI